VTTTTAGTSTVPAKAERNHRARKRRSAMVHRIVVLVLVAVFIGIPLWLVLVTSAKSQGDALNPSLALPSAGWHVLQNYGDVLRQGRFGWALLGTAVIVVPAVALLLLFGAMASWVLARRKSVWLSIVYSIAISGIVLPPAVITLVLLLRQLSVAGTIVGMVLVYLGIYMSTSIFFITGFIRTIPPELEEAATVDGAGAGRIFFTLVLPLLRPVLATATILICLYIWNDVFYAFFVIGGRLDTLPLNLFQVASAGLYLNNWHLIFAYVVLMSLPLLTVFVVAQRRIISGITGGAVK
jgi:raffinose/stachyose/melibiose transport system permease protein